MENFKIFKYKFLCTDFGKKFFKNNFRQGIILGVKIRNTWGYGEYAPLDQIHFHSLGDIISELSNIKLETNYDPSFENLSSLVENLNISNQAKYVFSLACFHIWVKKNIMLKNQKKILLSKLIFSQEIAATLKEILQSFELGYRVFKIKIKNNNLLQEIEKIKKIRKLVGKDSSLRLDFNSGFKVDELVKFVRKIQSQKIEYFEEPLADFSLNNKISCDLKINLAVDENFGLGDSFDKFNFYGVKNWIIKPSRFGNIFELVKLILHVKKLNIRPILSTCFESDLGVVLHASLVFLCGLENCAHGVFIPGMFTRNIFSSPLVVQRGFLNMSLLGQYLKNFSPSESPWVTRIV